MPPTTLYRNLKNPLIFVNTQDMWLPWAFCSAWNMALPIGVCSWYQWVSWLQCVGYGFFGRGTAVWIGDSWSCLEYQNIQKSYSWWWFQTFFIFNPIWGRWTHFDEHIFQMGWFNHQPVDCFFFCLGGGGGAAFFWRCFVCLSLGFSIAQLLK